MLSKIEEYEEGVKEHDFSKVTLTQTIKKQMIQYGIDDKIEIINVILSTIFVTFFIFGTYYENKRMASLYWPELVIEIYFLVDYFFFFLLADNRLVYMFGIQSLITYVSVTPQILITSNIVTDDNIQLYELSYWKVFRLFSIHRMSRIFIKRNNTLARIYFQLVFWVSALLLMFTFTMLMVENRWCVELIKRKIASNPYY